MKSINNYMKNIPADYINYRRSDGKWYFVYKVVYTSTGQFYIGSRATYKIDDKYYGTPSKRSKYFDILQICKEKRDYNKLSFTILRWTDKNHRYQDEEYFLQQEKENALILNCNFRPTNTYFAYGKNDKSNPFICQKEKISQINRKKNIRWAGIYHFYHPTYGDFKCTITELIEIFKNKNIVLDRGRFNLLSQIKTFSNPLPIKYKYRYKTTPKNKYYLWECRCVIKEPFLRK
jgi:hypothetical protein